MKTSSPCAFRQQNLIYIKNTPFDGSTGGYVYIFNVDEQSTTHDDVRRIKAGHNYHY